MSIKASFLSSLIFYTMTLSLFGLNLFAEPSESSDNQSVETKSSFYTPSETWNSKKIAISVAGGAGDFFNFGPNIEYIFNREHRLILGIREQNLFLGGSPTIFGDSNTAKITSIDFGYKAFVTKTIFLSSSLSYENFQMEFKGSCFTGCENRTIEQLAGTALSVQAVLGQEWDFSTFFIGSRWLGLRKPISAKFSKQYSNTHAIENGTELPYYKFKLVNDITIFTEFYLGWGF